MRGKLRFAMICGALLIFGASAVAVGKKARKRQAPDKAAAAETAPAKADTPLPAPTKVDVKCNIPPIRVNVAPSAAPTPAKGEDKAAPTAKAPLFNWSKVGRDLLLTLIFSLLGLAIALFGYFVYHWIVPFDLRKELEIDQNTSLGIVAGSIILGLCIIVAAAIASPS
jgi:hypothetical protein